MNSENCPNPDCTHTATTEGDPVVVGEGVVTEGNRRLRHKKCALCGTQVTETRTFKGADASAAKGWVLTLGVFHVNAPRLGEAVI